MRYEHIMFAQGDDAETYLSLLDEQGLEALVKDCFDQGCGEITDDVPWGSSDTNYLVDFSGYQYIVTVNYSIGYVGVTRLIPDGYKDDA